MAYTQGFTDKGIFVSETGASDEPEMLIDKHVSAFAWSPDGDRLALVAGRPDPSAPPPRGGGLLGLRWELHIVRLSGGTPDRILEVDANEMTWSPDGEWIVLQRAYGYSDPGGPASDLWVVHPDGTGLRRVTNGERSGTSNNCASWIPDEVVNEALSD